MAGAYQCFSWSSLYVLKAFAFRRLLRVINQMCYFLGYQFVRKDSTSWNLCSTIGINSGRWITRRGLKDCASRQANAYRWNTTTLKSGVYWQRFEWHRWFVIRIVRWKCLIGLTMDDRAKKKGFKSFSQKLLPPGEGVGAGSFCLDFQLHRTTHLKLVLSIMLQEHPCILSYLLLFTIKKLLPPKYKHKQSMTPIQRLERGHGTLNHLIWGYYISNTP